MQLLAVFEEVVEIVVVVRYFFECEVLPESLSEVEDLEIFPLQLLQRSTIDMCKFRQFRNRPHSNIRISKLIPHRVVFHTQRLNILKLRSLSQNHRSLKSTKLHRKVFEGCKTCDILAQLLHRIPVENKFIQFGQFRERMEFTEIDKIGLF